MFFDSLFPSFQSTTPETVISDYRQRKRADSRAEHGFDDTEETNVTTEKNNVEFYAEVIGKLVGTIRDGFTSLIDDVKQRNSKGNNAIEEKKEWKNEKLKNSMMNETNVMMHMKGLHVILNTTEANKVKMTNESASPRALNSSTSNHEKDLIAEHPEIKLALTHHDDENESESNDTSKGANEKIQSATSWDGSVVQVIARRKKHKRSEVSRQQDQHEISDDEIDVEQLEFPIASIFPFNVEMTNDQVTSHNSDGNLTDQPEDSRIFLDPEDNENNQRWFAKHKTSLAKISENHRRRKEKLIKFLHEFLTPQSANITFTEENNDQDSLNSENEADLTFAITRGNSTVIHLTPKQFLRMFHRGSDEHAELQKRTKNLLQRAFYKYARLYLLARKGYKDVRSFNKMVKEHHQEENEEIVSEANEDDFSLPSENYESLNQVHEAEYDDEVFATNDARSNIQAIEGFAILILEIFGAMLGLTLGAIGQIQSGFIFDVLHEL